MNNFMEVIPNDPIVLFATGGTVVAVGSLAYNWWQDRQARKMGNKVVEGIRRSVEDRVRKGDLFFSYEEIRRLMGQIVGAELEELAEHKKLDRKVVDFIKEQIARKMGVWELFPKPKACERPDPIVVKTTIRQRLSNGSLKIMPFPDLSFPSAEKSLADKLRTIIMVR